MCREGGHGATCAQGHSGTEPHEAGRFGRVAGSIGEAIERKLGGGAWGEEGECAKGLRGVRACFATGRRWTRWHRKAPDDSQGGAAGARDAGDEVQWMLVVVVVVILAACVIGWVSSWLKAGEPLSMVEIEQLVSWRIEVQVRAKYKFKSGAVCSDVKFKKAMVPDGAYHNAKVPVPEAPGVIASHLKHKKHEWIVFAYCRDDQVVRLWCNKGPDKTMVAPTLPLSELGSMAVSLGCHAVMRLHNHPNSYGARMDLLEPSRQDLVSSENCGDWFASRGIEFIDIVCERGDWLVFAWRVASQPLLASELHGDAMKLNAGPPAARRAARAEIRSGRTKWSSRGSRDR